MRPGLGHVPGQGDGSGSKTGETKAVPWMAGIETVFPRHEPRHDLKLLPLIVWKYSSFDGMLILYITRRSEEVEVWI